MYKKRIIPCLDTMNGKVCKGVNFVDIKDIGDPVEIAKKYEEQGADELVLLDITATLERRETMYELLRKVSSAVSIPVTLGGGIRSIEEFGMAIANGAAKVSINSAAVKNPDLIRQVSEKFGGDRVVVAIDFDGGDVYIKGGQEKVPNLDLTQWAKRCEELGAGELLPTSIGGDGVQNGYDIEMTKAIVDTVSIPVIASGGCGSIQDIVDVFEKTKCDAALVASLLHYGKATVREIKEALI